MNSGPKWSKIWSEYQLAPLLAAAAPAATVVAIVDRSVPGAGMLLLGAAGVVSAAVGWGAIVALGIEPTATLVPDQPGAVFAEVLAGALLGVALAAALLWRRGRLMERPNRNPAAAVRSASRNTRQQATDGMGT